MHNRREKPSFPLDQLVPLIPFGTVPIAMILDLVILAIPLMLLSVVIWCAWGYRKGQFGRRGWKLDKARHRRHRKRKYISPEARDWQ